MCMACDVGETLGLPLPVTLLYDCQSVTEIAAFIDGRLTGQKASGAAEDGTASGEQYAERSFTGFCAGARSSIKAAQNAQVRPNPGCRSKPIA